MAQLHCHILKNTLYPNTCVNDHNLVKTYRNLYLKSVTHLVKVGCSTERVQFHYYFVYMLIYAHGCRLARMPRSKRSWRIPTVVYTPGILHKVRLCIANEKKAYALIVKTDEPIKHPVTERFQTDVWLQHI